MKKHFRGFTKIFSFTFLQHTKSKGYKNSTLIIALLCLLVPAIIMTAVEYTSLNDEPTPEPGGETVGTPQISIEPIDKLIVVDTSDEKLLDLSALPLLIKQGAGVDTSLVDMGDDFDAARKAAKGDKGALILVTELNKGVYTTNIIIPEDSDISEDVAYEFQNWLNQYTMMLSQASGGQTPGSQVPDSQMPGSDGASDGSLTDSADNSANNSADNSANNSAEGDTAENSDNSDDLKGIVNMVLSYINIMLLYFFVLAYGQGVANSVVMEKSSKLMENFLVSVKPAAIILGKLLAITATGIIQLLSWIVSLGVSFAVGTAIVKSINPQTDMMIIELFKTLKTLTEGMFSPVNCIMAALMVMAGMLLYCALAGIGGAMASKTEDLSSTNVIFTLILVISFFATLYGGGLTAAADGESVTAAAGWLDWIPFTAVMITPAQILTGSLPLWKTLVCFVITLGTSVLATALAGKIYKAFVLYKGKVLNPKTAIEMIRRKRKTPDTATR